jgi:hypothetical protein
MGRFGVSPSFIPRIHLQETSMRHTLILTTIAASLLCGCTTPPKVAQKKNVTVAGRTLEFGGEYDTRNKALTLSVNGDPVMAGSFPMFTPTQHLRAEYQGLTISADCYFGSVLGSRPGVLGIVAGAVQSGQGKSGDTCSLLVGDKVVESLYF